MLAAFVFTTLVGVIPAEAFSEARRVEDSAIAYLREAADAQYFYKEYDPSSRTVAGVSEKERSELAKKTAAYADFRSARRADMPYDDTAIATGELKNLEKNLELHKKSVAYYAHLGQLSNSTYKAFAATYDVVETKTEGDIATIDLYETLDFQYSDVDFDSSAMTHFLVSMVKHGGKWLVMSVESDDDLYATYREKDFDLEAELAGIDAAREMSEEEELDEATRAVDDAEQERGGVNMEYDRPYKKEYAANYALTYTKRGPNGVGGASGSSPWKNTNFCYGSYDCMRFASQCVWSGLGGSNKLADIRDKHCMDVMGTNKWQDEDVDNKSTPWNSTDKFLAYVKANANGNDGTGLVCDTIYVDKNNNKLTGSKITQSDLLGAVLLVRGGRNRHLGHAVVLTKVMGKTRDDVYFTAYNTCFRNYKLSNRYRKSNSICDAIQVIAPRYLKNGNPTGRNYAYGSILPAVKYFYDGYSVTGYAYAQVRSLTVTLYKPNGQYCTSATANNAYSVTIRKRFDIKGDWKAVVSGTGLDSFTYIIRVADVTEVQSDTTHRPQ